MRGIFWTLLATTALTSVSFAQTAPQSGDQQQPQQGQQQQGQQQAQQPAGTTPAPAQTAPRRVAQGPAQQSFGTVYAAPTTTPTVHAQTGLTASPTDYGAMLQRAADQIAAQQKTTPGGVNRQELGGGHMINEQATKSRSTVTRDAIDKLAPTANPYQMINLLPGVVQSSTDNSGLNGGNIRIRGFNSDHIGLTIEGMPVNDSGNYALYPQEYVDAPNIGHISIAQGTPEVDSPHIGAAGGVINIYMRDPNKEMGGFGEVSVGPNNLKREFIRAESGEINGVSAYVSYSHYTEDHWIGAGKNERDHIDLKMKWELGGDNTIRFAAIYNDALNNFYKNPTLADFNSGKLTFPTTGKNFDTNYYDYRINPFKNLILSAPSNFTLNDRLKFDTIPYYWFGFGNGGGVTSLSESAFYWGNIRLTADLNHDGDKKDKVLYYNPSITETHRPGVINKFTYTLGSHEFIAGHWFEYAMHNQWGPFDPLDPNGNIQDPFGRATNYNPFTAGATCNSWNPVTKTAGGPVICPNAPMQKRDTFTTTMTNAFFVGDTWKMTDRLTLNYGVKEVLVDRQVTNLLPGQPGESLYDTATLPTVGARYKVTREHTIFGSYGTTFRSAPNYTLSTSVSTTSGSLTPIDVPEPETGDVFEIGHRYQGRLFSTSITGFYGIYDNFQQTTSVPDPAGTGATVFLTKNVGGLLNYGVDAEFGTRPIDNFRPYVSAELLHTEMLDNLPIAYKGAVDYLPTKGKALPGAPEFSVGVGLDYDNGHWMGNIGFKYFTSQYSTYMNDEELDAFGRMDAMVGYRFSDVAGFKAPELRLNLFNLFDTRDLTGVNGITNNAKTATSVKGNPISGSAPNYYLGQDFSFMLTFRTGL